MDQVKYKGEIEKFLLELASLNIVVQVTGIAWGSIVKKGLPLKALRRPVNNVYGRDR